MSTRTQTLRIDRVPTVSIQQKQLRRLPTKHFHLARNGRPGPVVIEIPKTSQRRRLPIRV